MEPGAIPASALFQMDLGHVLVGVRSASSLYVEDLVAVEPDRHGFIVGALGVREAAGISIAARIAMMAMTTRSSMSVKPSTLQFRLFNIVALPVQK